jgi:hypothetical protein
VEDMGFPGALALSASILMPLGAMLLGKETDPAIPKVVLERNKRREYI